MPSTNTKKEEVRTRDVTLWWERDEEGPIIPRTLPPLGIRTAEGFVWGHKLEHLFWVQRIPRVNAVTLWSRSMLKELGEGYDEHEWDEPLVEPRALRPWPVLKLAEGHSSATNPPIGAIDGGCECEHAEQVSYQIRPAEVYPEREGVSSGVRSEPDNVEVAKGEADNVQVAKSESDANKSKESDPDETKVPDADTASGSEAEKAKDTDTEKAKGSDVQMTEVDATVSQPASEPPADEHSECASTADNADEESSSGTDASEPGSAESAPEEEQNTAQPENHSPSGGYSVKDLPKLEEFIPEDYFPDVLMVHDCDNVTNQPKEDGIKSGPIKYIRCYPTFKRDDEGSEPRVAQLHFAKENRFGTGNHSYVYRAPLALPLPLSAHSPTGQVTVAAKLAYSRCTAHNLLRNEARVYNSFPSYIQEEYCGYEIVPQCRFPVPATAIVPKFFGYYLPVNVRGEVLDQNHENCSESRPCSVNWPSPILLMEECGNPVEPSKFTIDQRTECFSLILRLHYLEIVQGSFYVRNIMIQPGPLTAPPEQRTYDTPSFRIIDFGRGESWDWHIEKAHDRGSWREPREKLRNSFMARISDELHRARRELLIEDFGF